MDITINLTDGVPIYRQIVNQVKYLVASGLLLPGEELPPIRTLALQLNNVFRRIDGAALEPGVTESKAVADMEAILADDDMTVADLATANDENYRFFGEVK